MTLILIAGINITGGAQAWSNGGYSADESLPDYGTHDWIAEIALSHQVRDATFLYTYHARFLLGTEAPDNSHYIGDTWSHHIYFYGNGSLQDDSCAARASSIAASVLTELSTGDLESAAFAMGTLTHYISDVGVFGHTMGNHTDWGAEAHHSDYEDGVNERFSSWGTPWLALGNQSAYDATLALARDITFGKGSIEPNAWMDSRYNWSDAIFVASAKASMNATVKAVAAVMNNLLFQSG